jgi:Fe2+ transport system protein FeoA
VLLLVVDQDEKAAVTVVERIDAHRFSNRLIDMGITSSRPYGSP